jgi:hypothetical protein
LTVLNRFDDLSPERAGRVGAEHPEVHPEERGLLQGQFGSPRCLPPDRGQSPGAKNAKYPTSQANSSGRYRQLGPASNVPTTNGTMSIAHAPC